MLTLWPIHNSHIYPIYMISNFSEGEDFAHHYEMTVLHVALESRNLEIEKPGT